MGPGAVASLRSDSRNWLLAGSIKHAEVSSVWLGRSRFAVGLFPGFAVFLSRATSVAIRRPTKPPRVSPSFRVGDAMLTKAPPCGTNLNYRDRSFTVAVLISISLCGQALNITSVTANPSRRSNPIRLRLPRLSTPAALMSFGSLQHMQDAKVRNRWDSPSHRVPPSGFGYPPDGLLPSCPRRFCFTPAALLGFPFGAFSSRKVDACFHAAEPTCRWPIDISPPQQGPARKASASGF